VPATFHAGTEHKIFDPRDAATGANGDEVLDATVAWRDGRWWMCLAGQAGGHGATDLYSASLPDGAPIALGCLEIDLPV
jgi:hypothetical protein